MEDFKILDADNDCFKSVTNCGFDSFKVWAVNFKECLCGFDNECFIVSPFIGELN